MPLVQIRAEVERLGVAEGFVNILSRHTTTAIAINECEARLLDDIRQVPTSFMSCLQLPVSCRAPVPPPPPRRPASAAQFLRKLAPPNEPYLHNDLQYREAPPDWPGGWEAW